MDGIPIIGQPERPSPHPPLAVQGPDGKTYIVPVCIVLGVEANTNAALAAATAALVIAELEKRGVIPPRKDEET
jgi:hypothetical protein